MVALRSVHQTGASTGQGGGGNQTAEAPTFDRCGPKQRTKRIHLTGDDGSFLTPTEETAMCVHHIATKWHGPALILPASARLGVP